MRLNECICSRNIIVDYVLFQFLLSFVFPRQLFSREFSSHYNSSSCNLPSLGIHKIGHRVASVRNMLTVNSLQTNWGPQHIFNEELSVNNSPLLQYYVSWSNVNRATGSYMMKDCSHFSWTWLKVGSIDGLRLGYVLTRQIVRTRVVSQLHGIIMLASVEQIRVRRKYEKCDQISHFGKILKIFGYFLKVYLVFGNKLNRLWQIFVVKNGQILNT